jgi:hypothetical protein
MAISAVKIIMQATGETTMSEMTRDSSTVFTSKCKQMIKSLTGNAAEDNTSAEDNGGGDSPTNNDSPTNDGEGN